jgi:hypothetical protein
MQIIPGLEINKNTKEKVICDEATSKTPKEKQKYITEAWQRVSSFATT